MRPIAHLTRLLLKPGDQLTRMDGSVLTVTALQEQGGVITYEAEAASGDHHSVVETELDAHIELNTPIERLLNNQLGKPRDFGLRMTTLEHAAAGAGFGLEACSDHEPPCSRTNCMWQPT